MGNWKSIQKYIKILTSKVNFMSNILPAHVIYGVIISKI